MAAVWLKKDSSNTDTESYKDTFEREKRTTLFLNLENLHHYWTHFSELGHSSALTVLSRITQRDAGTSEFGGHFQFFEVDPTRLSAALDAIFDAVVHMEQVLFRCFQTRLDLDTDLGKMRKSLEEMRGRVRL